MNKKIIFFLVGVAWMAGSACGTIYYVDGSSGSDGNTGLSWAQAFATIQKGIDTASNTDVVEVNECTYYEYINFRGKAITVKGTDPNDWDVIATIIIDANGQFCTVAMNSSEDANSVLSGFTLRNGTYGVYCAAASPVIRKCIIEDNSSMGIHCTSISSSPLIMNNIIRGNGTAGVSCGVFTSPTIKNNLIYDNSYGVRTSFLTSPVVRNNTIVANSIAGFSNISGSPTISNCIVWDSNDDLSGCTATYSCIEDGDAGTGNIISDPRFVDADANNFHLLWNSPCFNAGDPNDPNKSSTETDIDGEARVSDGRVDIGADENYMFKNLLMNSFGQKSEWDLTHTLVNPDTIKYFSPNFAHDVRINTGADYNELPTLLSELRRINPYTTIYTAMSACKTLDPNIYTHFPHRALYYDDVCDESWYLHLEPNNYSSDRISAGDGAYVLDVRNANVRSAIIDKAIQNALDHGYDGVFFDNCYWGITAFGRNPKPLYWPEDINYQDWTDAFMDFFADANQATEANGLDLLVNVSIITGDTNEAVIAIEPYVDGIMNEYPPLHPNARTDKELIEELHGYEEVLKAGKAVLLLTPRYDYEWEKFGLGKIRPLAEKYGTIHLSAAGTFHEEPLRTYNTNLVTNGDFNDWTGANPNNWTITGRKGGNRKITQVGYFAQKPYNYNNPHPYLLQDHNGLNNKTRKRLYGVGACNLYATRSKNIAISQNITTVIGQTYRFSIFIGKVNADDPDDPNLVGNLMISGDNGDTFQYFYDTFGTKTFTFDATSTTTTLKIGNDPNDADISFDDIAIWAIEE